jgi:hypothetical protein
VSTCPESGIVSIYADNFYRGKSSSNLQTISDELTEDLSHISKWAEEKNLVLAPEKSCITLFTPDPHQFHHHPQILLNGAILPLNKTPKYLGIFHDTQNNYSYHTSEKLCPQASKGV